MHPEIGNEVDVTSNYENEADNLRRARNPCVPFSFLLPEDLRGLVFEEGRWLT